jgi:hypothetical protein
MFLRKLELYKLIFVKCKIFEKYKIYHIKFRNTKY